MTWIWAHPEEHRGRATRTESLRLVPSQFTERHQAQDVPGVWPFRPSIVERAAEWWYARTWPAWVCVIAAIAAVTFGIVAAI